MSGEGKVASVTSQSKGLTRKSKDKKRKASFRTHSSIKKDKKIKDHGPLTLWVKVGSFDPLPVEVERTLTVHQLKKRLQQMEDFTTLHALKLHHIKLFVADGDSTEESPNGDGTDEVEVRIVGVEGSSDSTSVSTAFQDELAFLKKQVQELKDAFSRASSVPHVSISESSNTPRSTSSLSTLFSKPTSTTSNGKGKGPAPNETVEALTKEIKRQFASVNAKLDAIDVGQAKKNQDFENTIKQLHVLTSTLKRVGGIPAVENDFAPRAMRAIGGTPFLRPKETLVGHQGPVWGLAIGENHLYSGSSDKTLKIWDLTSLRPKTLTGHTDIIHSVAVTADEKMVISGSDDRTIKFWNVEDLKCSKSISEDNIACCLRVAHNHLFSGSFKSVKVWNLKKHKQVHILPGHNHWVRALHITGGYLFTGGHNVIKMFDMANFNLARTMKQSCGSIYGIVVSGNMLLAATYENTVNIWDLRSHDYVRSLVGHSGAVYSVALSGSDNNKLMSGSYDNTIRVWDLRTMKALQRATSHSSSVEALVSKDDKVYSGSSDQTIKIWRMPGSGQNM